jgi:hypothetical protein
MQRSFSVRVAWFPLPWLLLGYNLWINSNYPAYQVARFSYNVSSHHHFPTR